MAMPLKVLATEPPVISSMVASLKLPVNSVETEAPAMSVATVSSAIVSSVALPLATGASFTAVTVSATVSVAVEKAVVPPLLSSARLVSAVEPLVPLLRSHARRVTASAIGPFQFPVGLK